MGKTMILAVIAACTLLLVGANSHAASFADLVSYLSRLPSVDRRASEPCLQHPSLRNFECLAGLLP
ncbi:MAG: hypothetical protein ACLPV8_13435 [Steroidobacteraceae bacterium]